MSGRTVSLEALMGVYGELLDPELVRQIHSDVKGNRAECFMQLSVITGVDDPEGSAEEPPVRTRSDDCSSPLESDRQESDAYYVPYDDAILQGEERTKVERRIEVSELMKQKLEDLAELMHRDREFDKEAQKQRALGPQSNRGGVHINLQSLSSDPYHRSCFQKMLQREIEHCGEFVVLYHSYSVSALLYEAQSCIARVLYGLQDDFAPAARLLKGPFHNKPHLSVLLKEFSKMSGQDHSIDFRSVAISTSVSLLAPQSEAPPTQVFAHGYSCGDVQFQTILSGLLNKLGVPNASAGTVATALCKVGSKFGLLTQVYSRDACVQNGPANPGHMLQIFVRADCVDDVAYGSHAYGVYDESRNPLSRYLTAKTSPDGQARLFWHPTLLMDPKKCRVYHYAADKRYAEQRHKLQSALQEVLAPLWANPQAALRTFYGIEGST